jgi:hypothetical protein
VIFYFLIRFSEDKAIMGEFVSKGFAKWFLRVIAVVILIAVLSTFVGKFML